MEQKSTLIKKTVIPAQAGIQKDQKSTQIKKILIAAGGTGGHILPALSIADCLVSIDDTCQVHFVHGYSDLEKSIYSQSSFTCHRLSVGRLRKNVGRKEKWKTIFSLPIILLKALKLVIKVNPCLVLGMGGAVSGPVLLAAFLLRKKTVIFESNVVPGLTSRWLSRFVNEVIVVFDATKDFIRTKKCIRFPFPVRSQINKVAVKNHPDNPLRILVLGGSQGSSVINKVVSEIVIFDKALSFSFIHQTGEKEFEFFKKKYSDCENVKVFPFLLKMHEFYEWADIVIGRAGVGTIAELSASGRAGILIPLASSSDQHQLKNAQDLKKKTAVILIEEKDFNKETLTGILKDLKHQPKKISQLSFRIHGLKIGAEADSMASYLLGGDKIK